MRLSIPSLSGSSRFRAAKDGVVSVFVTAVHIPGPGRGWKMRQRGTSPFVEAAFLWRHLQFGMYSNDKKVYSAESGDALTNLPKKFVSTPSARQWAGMHRSRQNVLPLSPPPFTGGRGSS